MTRNVVRCGVPGALLSVAPECVDCSVRASEREDSAFGVLRTP